MRIKYAFLILAASGVLLLTYQDIGLAMAKVSRSISAFRPAINPQGNSVHKRISVPDGYKRQAFAAHSVGSYLRSLPLKPHQAPVLLFDGRKKSRQDVHAAIINLEIGNKDLQQCADAVMRLRAEYLYKQKQYEAIHFNFTSGDRSDFTRYAKGYRPVIDGNKVRWVKTASPSYSYQTFRNYLDLVFTYAGTASLTKELTPIQDINQVQPGDVFIQGGFPGHAVMVMDVAVHEKTGKKIFLLAQSYMPAQEIHILRNPANAGLSPWYNTDISGDVQTPEWRFKQSDLKKFTTW